MAADRSVGTAGRLTRRPEQPEPYLRGVAWPAGGGIPYPRADPGDLRLPLDTRAAAAIPAGVHLELIGDADLVEVAYRTETAELGELGEAAGTTFTLWRAGALLAEEPAVLGEGVVRLPFGFAAADTPASIHLPEGMRPTVCSVHAVGGVIEPAPVRPRWLAYGDSITQGWLCSGPGRAWPTVAARTLGLHVVNLGYAGAARGEIASAEQIAGLEADVVTMGFGTSCWSHTPFTAPLIAATTAAFIDTVREGHPAVPIVVVTPPVRPVAEDSPNALGATLDELRTAQEAVVAVRRAADPLLSVVRGRTLVDLSQLAADGIHPNDEGHRQIAQTMADHLRGLVG